MMLATFCLISLSASLGFIGGALLSQGRRREVGEAYLTLASAVHDFTRRHGMHPATLRVNDLFVSRGDLRRLRHALERSQQLYLPPTE